MKLKTIGMFVLAVLLVPTVACASEVEITNESLNQGSDVDVGVRNNIERDIDEEVDLISYNNTTNGEKTTIEGDITFSKDDWEKVYTADLSKADEVRVEIDEKIVHSVGVES